MWSDRKMAPKTSFQQKKNASNGSVFGCQNLTICMLIIIVPWAFYINFRPSINTNPIVPASGKAAAPKGGAGFYLPLIIKDVENKVAQLIHPAPAITTPVVSTLVATTPAVITKNIASKTIANNLIEKTDPPVMGTIPTAGAQPLYGIKHTGGDAIFALACNYPKDYYQRFVGSLRKFGYEGDIVLAVSPPEKMKPGVGDYVKEMNVVAYGFEVECAGNDNCKLKDEFLGYADPRPHRTFANIRYALYEYWLRQYTAQSYILILDFRDTFFQGNPFGALPALAARTPKYDLRMFAENYKVKTIGKCVFNSLWIGRCFGKDKLKNLKNEAVICSGSTMGSYQSIHYYVR
jgi:hypothetical protein